MTDFSEMDGDSAVALNQNRSDAVNEGLLSTDLVDRLRHLAGGGAGPVNEICTKAADAIVAYRKTTGDLLDQKLSAALRAVHSPDTVGGREALEPFLAVIRVMDFYTAEAMPEMIFPKPEFQTRFPDEPRCVTLTQSDFRRLAALSPQPGRREEALAMRDQCARIVEVHAEELRCLEQVTDASGLEAVAQIIRALILPAPTPSHCTAGRREEITQSLAKFVMWAMLEGSWQGDDIDGGAAQDKAEALGLIVQVQYDPAKHGESAHCEPGDSWFVPSDALQAALTSEQSGPTACRFPECKCAKDDRCEVAKERAANVLSALATSTGET